MIVGIHPDRIGNESYYDKWAKVLTKQQVQVRKLDLFSPNALAQVISCDGVMWRWIHNEDEKQSAKHIMFSIEHYLDIPVFPNTRTAWHYDNKIAQLYLLKAVNAPMPETFIFWRREEAEAWAASTKYPIVYKLAVGAGSANVLKVQSKEEAMSLIHRMFGHGIFPMTMNEYGLKAGLPRSRFEATKFIQRMRYGLRYAWSQIYPPLPRYYWKPEFGYAYFQEFVPHNDYDTRVTVIGNRAFAFRRLNRTDDFRASGSGKLAYEPTLVDLRCVELAFKISERCGFQSMAYDFLLKYGEPVICEISYTFVDSAVYDCPGHWDRQLNWFEQRLWPEEAQVLDFIELIRSRSTAHEDASLRLLPG